MLSLDTGAACSFGDTASKILDILKVEITASFCARNAWTPWWCVLLRSPGSPALSSGLFSNQDWCHRRTDVSGMRSWLLNRRSVSADSWKTFSFSWKGPSVVHEISMIWNPALASTSGRASYFIRLVQQWDSIILVLLPFFYYSHWEFLCSAGIFISKLSSWWNMPDSYTRNLFICGISSL